MKVIPTKILFYITSTEKMPFKLWVEGLKEEKVQTVILERINRLYVGNFGDYRYLSKGLFELRIHHGPGYRIYFGITESTFVILCGGNKGTQSRDIGRALMYWGQFKKNII